MLLLRTAPLEFREQLMQGQVRYDDPRVTAVFARWASLLNKGYFNPDAHRLTWHKGANQMVFKGEAAMTLMGSWGMDYPPKNEQQWVMGKDYDVFPFPRIRDDVPQVALGSMDGLVLPKKAINKQGAKEVLTYLASQAQQQALTHNSGALAPTAQVPRTAYSDMQQHLFDHIDPGTNFVFLFDMSTPDVVADLGLDAFQEFLALPAAYPKILNRLAQSAAAYFQANPHH
jgi:multiple sugar transport system substrate-binding protein/raffinose/stachyose/melibiose transport system substrate-binding protein